jgi:hypothetical protein
LPEWETAHKDGLVLIGPIWRDDYHAQEIAALRLERDAPAFEYVLAVVPTLDRQKTAEIAAIGKARAKAQYPPRGESR